MRPAMTGGKPNAADQRGGVSQIGTHAVLIRSNRQLGVAEQYAGALVLLDAGLYSPAPSRQPSGGSIGAIVGSCIEGNRRAWGGLMNSVDDRLE